MPKLSAEPEDATAVTELLHAARLKHLRTRSRADILTVESGRDAFPHARFRRETINLWRLEMPTHTGGWERTPHRGLLDDLVRMLIHDYGWTLASP